MDTNGHKIGELIYWTAHPLVLKMKPKDSGGLWRVGIIVEYKTGKKYIVLSGGTLQECLRTMVQKLPVHA